MYVIILYNRFYLIRYLICIGVWNGLVHVPDAAYPFINMILLAACETEEVPQEVEAVKADETEEYDDKFNDRDGDVIEKATTASDPDSNEEEYESKYDKRLMVFIEDGKVLTKLVTWMVKNHIHMEHSSRDCRRRKDISCFHPSKSLYFVS